MSATPQRILAASRALFAARGYRATSLQAIADQVGITKAALYYHFASKEELLRHLTLPLLDELESALAEAESAGDPESSITPSRSRAAQATQPDPGELTSVSIFPPGNGEVDWRVACRG